MKVGWPALAGIVIGGVAILAVLALNGNGAEPVRQADAREIHAILKDRSDTILQQIALEKVEISLPLDGGGPRVLVRVEPGRAEAVPEKVVVEHGGDLLEVPLEASETYETYRAE